MTAPDRLRLRPPVTGPAKLIAFPISARSHELDAIAARIAKLDATRSELALLDEIRKLRVRMLRQGFTLDEAFAQMAALEGQVRARAWRAMFNREDAS